MAPATLETQDTNVNWESRDGYNLDIQIGIDKMKSDTLTSEYVVSFYAHNIVNWDVILECQTTVL